MIFNSEISAYISLRTKRDKKPQLYIESERQRDISKAHEPLKVIGKGQDSIVVRSPFHKDKLISLGINNMEVSGVNPGMQYKHVHRVIENLFPGAISHIGSVWGMEYRDAVRDEVVGDKNQSLSNIDLLANRISQELSSLGMLGIRIDNGKHENAIEDKTGKLVYVDTLIIKNINDLIRVDMVKLKKYFYSKCSKIDESKDSLDKRWSMINNSINHLQELDATNRIFTKIIGGGNRDLSDESYESDLAIIYQRQPDKIKESLDRINKYIDRGLKYRSAGHQFKDGRWYKNK